MPLYRDFVMPTAGIIPIDTSQTFERINADYQQRYDQALEAENSLLQMTEEARQTVRDADQPRVTEYILNASNELDSLSERVGKGLTLPKIKQAAGKFVGYMKPFQMAYKAEQQDLENLSKLNLTPQEIARRQLEIKNKPSVVSDEYGTRFSYQPYQYSERPDINKKLLSQLSAIRPDNSSRWNNSKTIIVDANGNASDISGNPVKTNQSTPGIYRIDSQGSSEKITARELREAGLNLITSDPDINKFLQEEMRVRMLEDPDLTQENALLQVTQEYIDNPLNNIAGMLDYDKSFSAESENRSGDLTNDGGDYDRGWMHTDDSVRLNLDPVKISGFAAKSFSKDPGKYETPKDKQRNKAIRQAAANTGDKNDRIATAAAVEIAGKTGIAQPTEEQTEAAIRVLETFADQYEEKIDITNPKDPNSHKVLEDYEQTVSNLAVVPIVIPYRREGEQGRSSREDITSDLQTNPTEYTWYDINSGKELSPEEKKNIPSINITATGEFPPNHPFVLVTENPAFSNSHKVVLKDEKGRIKNEFAVTKQFSENNTPKGKYNNVANNVYTTLMQNAGMWVEVPVQRDDFGNVSRSIKARVALDLKNRKASGYEIEDQEGKISKIGTLGNLMTYIGNARKQ